jgi:hypothetical protein
LGVIGFTTPCCASLGVLKLTTFDSDASEKSSATFALPLLKCSAYTQGVLTGVHWAGISQLNPNIVAATGSATGAFTVLATRSIATLAVGGVLGGALCFVRNNYIASNAEPSTVNAAIAIARLVVWKSLHN